MSRGSVVVKVNDIVGHYFQIRKEVWHGHLLSPILFNIVVNMLAIFISWVKEVEQIQRIIPHLVDEGLLVLQYADDTVIFVDNDLEKAQNMKILLCAFEQLSGLKINFHKSKLFC
jgi:hypothetical protein